MSKKLLYYTSHHTIYNRLTPQHTHPNDREQGQKSCPFLFVCIETVVQKWQRSWIWIHMTHEKWDGTCEERASDPHMWSPVKGVTLAEKGRGWHVSDKSCTVPFQIYLCKMSSPGPRQQIDWLSRGTRESEMSGWERDVENGEEKKRRESREAESSGRQCLTN